MPILRHRNLEVEVSFRFVFHCCLQLAACWELGSSSGAGFEFRKNRLNNSSMSDSPAMYAQIYGGAVTAYTSSSSCSITARSWATWWSWFKWYRMCLRRWLFLLRYCFEFASCQQIQVTGARGILVHGLHLPDPTSLLLLQRCPAIKLGGFSSLTPHSIQTFFFVFTCKVPFAYFSSLLIVRSSLPASVKQCLFQWWVSCF